VYGYLTNMTDGHAYVLTVRLVLLVGPHWNEWCNVFGASLKGMVVCRVRLQKNNCRFCMTIVTVFTMYASPML
jgi:hypothetical protein